MILEGEEEEVLILKFSKLFIQLEPDGVCLVNCGEGGQCDAKESQCVDDQEVENRSGEEEETLEENLIRINYSSSHFSLPTYPSAMKAPIIGQN